MTTTVEIQSDLKDTFESQLDENGDLMTLDYQIRHPLDDQGLKNTSARFWDEATPSTGIVPGPWAETGLQGGTLTFGIRLNRIYIPDLEESKADLPSNYSAYFFEIKATTSAYETKQQYLKRGIIHSINDSEFKFQPLLSKQVESENE